jgi:hypothetical protein
MVGYEVITSDDKKVGRVAEVHGDNVILEHGTVRKTRHALPKAFAHADDAQRLVRVTVPKEILLDSPKVGSGGDFDADAVAAHYGLAGAEDAPTTRGAGDEVRGDPAYGADTVDESLGLVPPEERRAEIRQRSGGDQIAPSPALLGDRTRELRNR